MKTSDGAFILDERYTKFVASKVKSQRLYHTPENDETSLLYAIISIFFVTPIPVIILVNLVSALVYSLQNSQFPVTSLIPFLILSLTCSWFIYIVVHEVNKAKKTYRKFRRLHKGAVLGGIVTGSLFTSYRYGKNQYTQIPLIYYAFYSPDGTKLFGSRKLRRRDLTEQTLPEEGTKVYVLYADDDCHMLL